jgi:hypothetical protein
MIPHVRTCSGVNPGGLGGRDLHILKWGVVEVGWGVVEGVVAGLLRSKREGRTGTHHMQDPQFSNQIRHCVRGLINIRQQVRQLLALACAPVAVVRSTFNDLQLNADPAGPGSIS